MRIRIALHALSVVLLGCALGACGGGSAASGGSTDATLPPVTSPVAPVSTVAAGIWVVMGSSTASGAGAAPGKGWVDLLQTAMAPRGAQMVNIAVGGSSTYHGLSAKSSPVAGRPQPNPAANIDQALSRKPVLLIVSYPTNDIALGYGVDEIVTNLLAIRAQALEAGVPVLLTSTQPRNLSASKLEMLSAIDAKLANAVGTCLVTVNSILAGPNGQLASSFDSGDGVHPNAAGHEKIAAEVIKKVDAGTCVRLLPP
jgi:acyl-CoA thioesterase-1